MTDDKVAPRALLEKGSDGTFLREMIGIAAARLNRSYITTGDTPLGGAHT